jgi:lipopolysaccharide exporter
MRDDRRAVSGSPRRATSETRAEPEIGLTPGPGPPPFWKTRAWWSRARRTTLAVYLATALAFLATVLVARALGPDEFGTVVLAVAIATLVATFLDLTLEEAVVHHGYRALEQGDTAGVLGLIRASLFLDVGIGVVVSSSVVLLAAPLADLASAGSLDPGLVRLAALVTLASTADSTMSAVLLVAGRPDLRGWVMAGGNLARLVAVVIAIQAGTVEAIIVAYAVGNAVGAVGQGLVAWGLVRRRWAAEPGSSVARVPLRPLARFGLHTSISTSLAAAHASLIPVILGRVAGATAVGLFRVAMFPVFVVNSASGPLRLVLFPEQARLAAAGDLGQLRAAIRSHTLAAVAVSVPFAVAAWFILPWLLPLLFSDRFDEAVGPARILLIAAVAHLTGSWFKALPAALGRPQLRTGLSLFELVLMLSLLVALGGEGAEGAAIAFTVASLVTAGAAFTTVHIVLRREEPASA